MESRNKNAPNGTLVLPPVYFYSLRRLVNVTVENEGKAIAKNCEIRLRLLKKTKDCQALSSEEKALMWNDNLEEKIDIGAKYGRRSFTIAFSQERFTQDVITETGQKVTSHFIITVGDNWKSLTAEMDKCDCHSVAS